MVSSLEKIPPITRSRLIQMGYKRAAQFENLRLSVCSKNKLAFVTIWANWSFQILQLENDDANAWEAFRCEWSQSRHNSSRAPLDDWCIQLHSVAMHQKRKWTTLCLQLRSNTKTQRTPVKREISRIGLFAQPVWGIQSSRNSFGLSTESVDLPHCEDHRRWMLTADQFISKRAVHIETAPGSPIYR